jgi:hypothetical protein
MVDTGQDIRNSRGLSRRDMIKGAAVAGAAAWTAPMIIDSLTSPAAAASGCTMYAVKLQPDGSVFSACFGGTASICFTASDAKWAGTAPGTSSSSCGASNPTFCPSGNGTSTNHLPSVSGPTTINGRKYYVVTWGGGTVCNFSSATGWQIGGRYEPGSPGSNFIQASGACSGGPTGGSNGCYDATAKTAWIPAFYAGNSGDSLNYIYLKYCCTS